MSDPVDLHSLILDADLLPERLEAEARRIYFNELVPHPPVIPPCSWMEHKAISVAPTEGGFRKIFGETEGWAGYSHRQTGRLSIERMRRAPWIRPVLELRVPKTKVYVNQHTLGPREFRPGVKAKKNRLFVTTGSNLMYFISLVHVDDKTLALATAFEPDGQWLRETLKKSGTILLGPPFP